MSIASFRASATPPASFAVSGREANRPIKVMIVDDSAVIRGLMNAWVGAAPDMEVIGSYRTGKLAVDAIDKIEADVCVLDIEMPDMNGIDALPLLLARRPGLTVIMASTLTRRNAEISMRCLSLGATDYVPKPDSTHGLTASGDYQRDIIEKIRSLGRRHVTRAPAPAAPAREMRAAQTAKPASTGTGFRAMTEPRVSTMRPADPAGGFALRPFNHTMPRALLIGSSTGGPQALNTVIAGLKGMFDKAPVLIVQHMPATFTTILAEHLATASGRPCAEGVDGEPILPGRIYVAPGGRHMTVRKTGGHPIIALDDGPPVHFCKPAVDPMFDSATQAFGGAVLGVVLTGMGHDGAAGAGTIVSAGGNVIAQDEATSVVWGMPGATALSGHCAAVLPLQAIAPKVVRLFAGDRS